MTARSARQVDVLALIPARGGSKGIVGKNLLPILGKPLIAYSIELARQSERITRVVVSTDDPEIARVAREHGAEVPFMRPKEYAADLSPDLDVFRHALEFLRDQEAYRCDLVVHLRPTAPARRVVIVDAAIDCLLAHPDADALRSVGRARQSPYKMWRIEAGRLEPVALLPGVPEPHSLPRQLLPDVYWQNGYVDVVRPSVILDRALMAGDRVVPFVIADPVPELDYPEDVARLEVVLRAIERGESLEPFAPAGMRHPV